MNDYSKRIAELSPEKLALLMKRLQQDGQKSPKSHAIPRRADLSSHPMSFAQKRLWFLDQLEPESSFYNIPAAVRFHGALDVAALRQSLNEVVQRHEVLRARFTTVDGEPVQQVEPSLTLDLPVVDLTSVPEQERERKLYEVAQQEAQRPFDLGKAPLLRTTLLRLRENEHVLLLSLHHIVADGWSIGVLIREVASLYEAFSKGKPSPLPELPIQYADFAQWQQEWLQGEVLEEQLSYWTERLRSAPGVLELPTDRPRPAVQTYRGAHMPFELSAELTAALKDLSRREGVTLFMTLLAAFQTLLYRYTDQDDVSVGVPVANRDRAGTEQLIGFFVNTLVMRTDLCGDPTFRELLARVRDVALGAFSHQDLPFEKLVDELQPERDLSHTPLFQVLFVLQNAPKQSLSLPGLTLELMEVEPGSVKFDLTLSLEERPHGLAGSVGYNVDLFDDSTIRRMIGHFRVLLGGVVSNPETPISKLPLLTEAERHRLVVEWSRSPKTYPVDKLVHEVFQEQVARTPQKIVCSHKGESLTYEELDRKAESLAKLLLEVTANDQEQEACD
jgi:non-ribosomal peptide synthetase component F